MPPRHAILLCVLLVLAGCGGTGGTATDPAPTTDRTVESTAAATDTTRTDGPAPTTTGTPAERTGAEPTATTASEDRDGYEIEVDGGTLPVDANRTFARMAEILGSDAEPPERVRIVDEGNAQFRPFLPEPLHELGAVPEASLLSFSGKVPSAGEVLINRATLPDQRKTHVTLAHEYVHTVQRRNDLVYDLRIEMPVDDADGRRAHAAVLEGAATYAETVYWRRHVRTGQSPTKNSLEAYRSNDDPAIQYFAAAYGFGARYVADQVDSPDDIAAVYDRPPKTMEAIIHGYDPGAEEPVPLSVTVDGDEWYQLTDVRRMGELPVRVVLKTELNNSAAATAGTGWGNDGITAFSGPGNRSYAWTLRWDDGRNATEFATHFRRYLAERSNRTGEVWVDETGTAFRLVETSDRTTVVFYGDPSFVREATAEGDANVTVTTP